VKRIVHPLLIAAFPVLSLYAGGMDHVRLGVLVVPLAIIFAVTLATWALLGAALGDRVRAAVLTSVWAFLLLSYGHFANAMESVRFKVAGHALGANSLLLPFWIGFGVVATWALIRTRRPLDALSGVMNVMAFSAVGLCLVQIGSAEVRRAMRPAIPEPMRVAAPTGDAPTGRRRPDIVYVILDRYASDRILREVYDYDNSAFSDALRQRGFYVATDSVANYPRTAHSIASSFNMSYLDDVARAVGPASTDWTPLYHMMEDYAVWEFLKSQGYAFVHIGSWFTPTWANRNADQNVNFGHLVEFPRQLYKSSLFFPIGKRLDLYDDRVEQWRRVPYELERLRQVGGTATPTFVFAHILVPHRPYVFDQDGRYLSREEADKRPLKLNYVNQVKYINAQVLQLLDVFLARPEPPVILIQADEGPFPTRFQRSVRTFDWTQATQAELREKMEILNTYYLPGVKNPPLDPSISPVNSFRVVFNAYFGTDLPLLPDQHFVFRNETHLYDFTNVTAQVARDEHARPLGEDTARVEAGAVAARPVVPANP
jgi:hypothetical protein